MTYENIFHVGQSSFGAILLIFLPNFLILGRLRPFRTFPVGSSLERERDLVWSPATSAERPRSRLWDLPPPSMIRSRLVDLPRAILRLGLLERPLMRDGLELLPRLRFGVAPKFCEFGFLGVPKFCEFGFLGVPKSCELGFLGVTPKFCEFGLRKPLHKMKQ